MNEAVLKEYKEERYYKAYFRLSAADQNLVDLIILLN